MFNNSIKLSLVFLLALASISNINAQVESVNISMGEDYSNQVFYSLSNGEQGIHASSEWDLAFDLSPFGTAIRTNGAKNTKLFLFPTGDTSSWLVVDTIGLSEWAPLYNSDTSWYTGAFNRYQSDFDIGWGNYDPITHNIIGDSIYILSAPGLLKKIWIEGLIDGAYIFRYANLDGTEEEVIEIEKGDYFGKNFVYFDLTNNELIDIEPSSVDWDIVFTKYVSEVAPGFYYGVTGALINQGAQVAKAYPVSNPNNYSEYQDESFSGQLNGIGYDWKEFDLTSGEYIIVDSVCFFVQDLAGDIWRLFFTGFDGSASGDISFEQELLSAQTSIEENGKEINFALYPNPAQNSLNVLFDSEYRNTYVSILDISGSVVYQTEGTAVSFNNLQIDINGLPSGIYMVNVVSGETSQVLQFVKQ